MRITFRKKNGFVSIKIKTFKNEFNRINALGNN